MLVVKNVNSLKFIKRFVMFSSRLIRRVLKYVNVYFLFIMFILSDTVIINKLCMLYHD